MVKVGDRIRLIAMGNDPDPIPTGAEGVVDWVNEGTFFGDPFTQVGVKWDNGRSLMMSVPPDEFVIIAAEDSQSTGGES